MLIRICDHFKDNPKRIDKLIAVKGLPEDWIFRHIPEGLELKKPWEADIDKNIPPEVRSLCEPTYIVRRFPPIDNQKKEVIEKLQILGIRIDYNSEPGRQLWDDIERYIEESTPRDHRIPVPVLCAKDEHSSFETYMPRRTSRGSLELVPAPVPLIDLNEFIPAKPVERPVLEEPKVELKEAPPAVPAEEPAAQDFACEDCAYTSLSKAGLRMHRMKKHPAKVSAGVS